MSARVFERLERVKYLRVEYFPVGDTLADMAEAMEWIRAKGHEADTLGPDGFRYRSIYPTPSALDGRMTSRWMWAEPGEWLVLMEGDGQDSELDMPHEEGPDDGCDIYPMDEWHEVSEADR